MIESIESDIADIQSFKLGTKSEYFRLSTDIYVYAFIQAIHIDDNVYCNLNIIKWNNEALSHLEDAINGLLLYFTPKVLHMVCSTPTEQARTEALMKLIKIPEIVVTSVGNIKLRLEKAYA